MSKLESPKLIPHNFISFFSLPLSSPFHHHNAIKFHFHLNSFIVNVYNLALPSENVAKRRRKGKSLRLRLITMQQVTQFNLKFELNLNVFFSFSFSLYSMYTPLTFL